MDTSKMRRLADEAMEELVAAVEDGKSRQLQEYLAMLGRFHRYSLGNVLLIASQKPDARRVAGYRAWQQLGRQVREGEKAIRILAPIVMRRSRSMEDDGDQDEQRDDNGKRQDEDEEVLAYKSACVFDVSQTEGKELAEFARVQGDPGRALVRLKGFVAGQGIQLEHSNRIGPAQGASEGGRIILRQDLGPAEEFSVLVHELAHEMLHQQAGEASKTIRETEAEAVAFAVCQSVGLDTNTAASDYIQLYDGKKETLLESLERIKATAGEIIEAVTAEEPQQAESPFAVAVAA